MILKNSQVTIYGWIKTFFCSVANVGLTDSSRIFFWWLPGVERFIKQSLHPVLECITLFNQHSGISISCLLISKTLQSSPILSFKFLLENITMLLNFILFKTFVFISNVKVRQLIYVAKSFKGMSRWRWERFTSFDCNKSSNILLHIALSAPSIHARALKDFLTSFDLGLNMIWSIDCA